MLSDQGEMIGGEDYRSSLALEMMIGEGGLRRRQGGERRGTWRRPPEASAIVAMEGVEQGFR